MFIFDHPYISDVADTFLQESQCPALSNEFTKKFVSEKANTVSEEEALHLLAEQDYRWVYSNSENAISWITDKLGSDSKLVKNIDLFKNKFKFRSATSHLFPEVAYKHISAQEIAGFSFDEIGKPFIIKPTVGFISAGVYRVDDASQWDQVKNNILQMTESVATAFPDSVLNSNFFLIESIIEGEEYAVDAYFDDNGNPVILNILHHKFSDEHDMGDRLYVTSAAIIKELHDPLSQFLTDIGGIGDFRGMPLHLEVRIDAAGQIVPIEVNPLRFAGWCSTDIAYYAYDINVYDYFANKKRPDWEALLKGKESSQYAMALIERSQPTEPGDVFDYDSLARQFSSLLCLRKIDYKTFPLYAFLFFQISVDNTEELENILHLDPEQFLIK